MARQPKQKKPKAADGAPAGHGHNSAGDVLTPDDAAALVAHYGLKIRGALKEALVAKAVYDGKREVVNGFFANVKGDLKFDRKTFEDLLAKQDMSEAEFRNSEVKRSKLYEMGGLPVGTQLDLIDRLHDTVDDQAAAYADGRRAGRRGDDAVPPATLSAVLHQDWMRGWSDEQAAMMMQLGRAEEIIAERAKPAVEPQDEKAEDEEPEFDPDAEARVLRKTEFMDRVAEPVAA